MAGEYNLILSSDEMCRNCLAQNCQLKSLFRCDIIDGEIWPIPKVYKDITNITVAQNDSFPQNICIKCETIMFEAFVFKQKSLKSHNLLRKILKISNEDQPADEMQVEIRSKSTQTCHADEDETTILISTAIDQSPKKIKQNTQFDGCVKEEDESNSDAWQLVYLTNDENEDEIIEQDLKSSESVEDNESEIQDMQSVEVINETLECQYCCEQIAQSLMRNHIKQHNNIMPSLLSSTDFFRCSRCLMSFPFIENLLNHLNADELCEKSAELDKIDACTDYQYLSNDPTNSIRLISTCKNIDRNMFSCSLCSLDFESLFTFRTHFQEEHLSNMVDNAPEYMHYELSHTCGICGNLFMNLQDCLQHIYFHQSTYACIYCNHVSDTFSMLYSHFSRSHSHKKFDCTHCSYVSKCTDDLKEHQRSMCPARNIKCETCGKSFYKKSTLNMHMRKHSNERRYNCSICSKKFLQNNDLANHMRTHTLERPYKCELCEKSFKTIGQRSGHMSTHTTEYNFECDVCQKSFKSARILHGHKKIHGERQFHCELCAKKFNRKYHLTLHMKRHDKLQSKLKAKKKK